MYSLKIDETIKMEEGKKCDKIFNVERTEMKMQAKASHILVWYTNAYNNGIKLNDCVTGCHSSTIYLGGV